MININFLKAYIVFSFVLVSAASVKAQDVPVSDLSSDPSHYEPQGYNAMNKIKTEIVGLLEENRLLKAEYEDIHNKFLAVQMVYGEKKKEMDALYEKAEQSAEIKNKQAVFLDGVQDNLDGFQNDVLLNKSRNLFLQNKLMDEDEKKMLLSLQVSALELEKKELDVEYKFKQSQRHQDEQRQLQEISRMKQSIKQNLEKERELAASIDEIEYESSNFPKQAEDLKRANESLQIEIEKIRKQKEFQDRENQILADKKALLLRSKEDLLSAKEQEGIFLRQNLTDLEKEYNAMNEQIQASISEQSTNREATQSVIALDRENQELRRKIIALREKLNALQP